MAAGSLAIIGLANVAGSLTAGWAGGVMRMKWLLFAMYFSRAVAVAVYLAAPKTALTFYLFAAVLGFTWLATVPPTAGLIGKLFGVRYLATLFGLATLHAPDRRILRRLARRQGADRLRRFLVDVVRRHRAGAGRGVHQPADPRSEVESGAHGTASQRNGSLAPVSIRPSAARAALSGNTLAVQRAGRHAEMIAQHALHHRAQVARGLEVACSSRLRAREPRPVGEHAATGHRAA